MAVSMKIKEVLWENKKTILQVAMIFFVVNLLFLSAVSSVGLQVFIDTFEQSENYVFVKNHSIDSEEELLIVMNSNHPDFSKEQNATLLRIKASQSGPYDTSYSSHSDIGKVVGSMNDDVFSKIIFSLWEASTETLNVFSLIPQ